MVHEKNTIIMSIIIKGVIVIIEEVQEIVDPVTEIANRIIHLEKKGQEGILHLIEVDLIIQVIQEIDTGIDPVDDDEIYYSCSCGIYIYKYIYAWRIIFIPLYDIYLKLF